MLDASFYHRVTDQKFKNGRTGSGKRTRILSDGTIWNLYRRCGEFKPYLVYGAI